MKLIVFNPNGAWVAMAYVLSSGRDGQHGPTALDPVRRPRVGPRPPAADTAPRTWVGRLRLERLQLLLPTPGKTTFLDVTFHASIAPLACVLDDPSAESRTGAEQGSTPLSVVSTSFERAVSLSNGSAWASWVERAWFVQSNDALLRAAGLTSPAASGRAITPAEVFSLFGLAAPTSNSALLVDVDGLLLQGARQVPWWDPSLTSPTAAGASPTSLPELLPMPGLFRFESDLAALPARRDRLVVERSPRWRDSLARYQATVVQATASRLDASGLPAPGSPDIGLAAAPLPAEIAWIRDATGWVFNPGSSLFDVELRGVAGGVARWSPAALQLTLAGARLACSSSAPASGQSDAITYSYQSSGEPLASQWSGDFEVTPDPDDLLLTLQTRSNPEDPGEDALWLLTETGAFHLPVDRPQPTKLAAINTGQRLLKGLFHLAEVPWRAAGGEGERGAGPLVPDFRRISRTRLLVRDAGQIQATFVFQFDGPRCTCLSIQAALHDPSVRLEDFLPSYVPPSAFTTKPLTGPPPLPQPVGQDGPAPSYFFGLSFVRESRQVAAADALAWRVRLRFTPGRVREEPALEGDWGDTSIDVQLPPSKAARALYWFRPAGLRWIPALPVHGDPRLDPDHRLCAERTYMPLRPLAREPITFRLGDDWPLSILQRGAFSAPEMPERGSGTPPVFTWIAPELPGMGLALVQGERLSIDVGLPADGAIRWLIRHELPILDELFALQGLKEPSKPGAPAPTSRFDGPAWWEELTRLASLAQSQSDVLVDTPVRFVPGTVLSVASQPVQIHNLYARQSFPGLASLRAIPPLASVDFALPLGGAPSLIAADRLLEGASARFTVDVHDPTLSPVLTPSGDAGAPIEVRAGCLLPQVVETGARRLVFDQVGRVSFSLPEQPGRGRLTRVPSVSPSPARESAVVSCFQWSHPGLDLSSENVALSLYFVALPLELRGGAWVFDADSIGEHDAVLRDFRWGTLGPCRLWGVHFQVMRLERVEFPEAGAPEPDLPTAIVLAGVLHFMDSPVRLADEASQRVRLSLRRDGDKWRVEGLSGRFLWPLFEPTPDIADATRARLSDPLPWLDGRVALAATATGPKMIFGTPGEPARLVFPFLGRTWSLPVELAIGSADSLSGEPLLTGRILVSAAPPSTLAATAGTVTLGRRAEVGSVVLTFRLAIPLDRSPTHLLADLSLTLRINSRGSSVALDRVRLLASGEQRSLVTVPGELADGVEISSSQVSLALRRSPGFGGPGAPFELLPGWPVAQDAALLAYLSLSFVRPTSEVVTQLVGLEEFQLLLETSLAPMIPAVSPARLPPQPHRLSTLLVATLRPPAAQEVSIQLTGQLHVSNQLTWSAPGGETLSHAVSFTWRQATLPGERLVASSTRAFFSPRVMTPAEDPSGLSGMIELPALASHRLSATGPSGEREIAAWVAPQRVRLGAPTSFIEEVLLRGSKQVDLRVPGLPRVTAGLLALYVFDEGTGAVVRDRSGAGTPLDLSIADPNAVQWSEGGLIVRSSTVLASPQAATKILDACGVSNEITFEAWIRTPMPARRDAACLLTLSKNPGAGRLSLELRWDQDRGRPANYYHVTLRTTGPEQSRGSDDPRNAATLDSPVGALTAELTHLVVTRDAAGTAIIYVDGVERARALLRGPLASWDRQCRLVLGNELTGKQPWLGELRLVAVYQRALNAGEVRRNFQALAPPRTRIAYENGFAGPLGEALANALRKGAATADTMIIEATEAFWLRFKTPEDSPSGLASASAIGRDFAMLWRDGPRALAGLPTLESDFFPPDETTTHDWVRLPLPFLSDSAGVLGQTAGLSPSLRCALPAPGQAPVLVDGEPLVSRESLLHRDLLDRYSLGHGPPHPGVGSPVDQVLLGPAAWERLLPYTQPMPGFAPGWLVFTDWPSRTKGDAADTTIKPFAAAGEVLGRMAATSRGAGAWVAATEVTPEAVSAELPWQQLIGPDGRPRPYLLASPLLAIAPPAITEPAVSEPAASANSTTDLHILVEIWVPSSGARWGNNGVQPVLAARSVFRLAIGPDENWTTVLFTGPPDRSESPVRARVRAWVKQEAAGIFSRLAPLLRATTLSAASTLPQSAYFILPQSPTSTAERPVKRRALGSTKPLRPDLRFEALPAATDFDPLALGPDYLGGVVHYERRTWFEPPPPSIDRQSPQTAIDELIAEPAVVHAGAPVTFRWRTKQGPFSLQLGIKDHDETLDVSGKANHTLVPRRTAVYVLRAFSGGKPIDFREVAVVVRVPAAGSAVGLAYKLAGTAPGPEHASRLPWADPRAGHHRWVETSRDLMFLDLTRRDEASADEPGRFLPASRKLQGGSEAQRGSLRPFLPTRAVQIFTSGRPGSLMRVRTALLDEDSFGVLRRSASMAHEFRHPRPVPLPPELYPFDPTQVVQPTDPAPRRTCAVEPVDGPAPFRFARLTWQDPIFNRRLLAVGQEIEGNKLVLGLDRAVYAGVDVAYPEIRFIPETPGWRIQLTMSLHRREVTGSYTLAEVVYEVTDSAVNKLRGLQSAGKLTGIRRADTSKGVRRWVWEMGLNQPAVLETAAADNDNFDLTLQNYDEVRLTARVSDASGKEIQTLQLTGVVRTDIEVWPQPQNAFGILRTRRGGGATQTDLAAFGWLPKPRVIRRGDRFNPDSWEGTFSHTETSIAGSEKPLWAIDLAPGSALPADLDKGIFPEALRAAFSERGVVLTSDAVVSALAVGREWLIAESGSRSRKHRVVRDWKGASERLSVSCLFDETYEVLSFTAYGEQAMPEPGESDPS
ncbi:MAG: LamG domain-containing protein [Polyangiaceae bacterium]|nr:LamG domain-containing protein [Polyangiaceae bacterium]